MTFDENGGEFTLDCLTGSICGPCEGETAEFEWDGNDEMDDASGRGWVTLRDDGSLEGEISVHNADDIPFIARRHQTSSTAC
jgi:hypothetical protein